MESNGKFILTKKAKKLLAFLLSKKVFFKMREIVVLSEPENEGVVRIKSDAIQAKYLMLHPTEIDYIITGWMLDFLKIFYEEHRFSVSTNFYSLPDISEVRADISIDVIY